MWRTRTVRRIAVAVVEPGPMQGWRWERALESPGHWDRGDLEGLEPGGFGAASAVRAPRRCGQRLWGLRRRGTEPFSQGEAVNRHVESGVLFCFFYCKGGVIHRSGLVRRSHGVIVKGSADTGGVLSGRSES